MHGLIFETSIWLLAGSTRCFTWAACVSQLHMSTKHCKRLRHIRETRNTTPMCTHNACTSHRSLCCHIAVVPHRAQMKHSIAPQCIYDNSFNCNICCNCIFKITDPREHNCYKELRNYRVSLLTRVGASFRVKKMRFNTCWLRFLIASFALCWSEKHLNVNGAAQRMLCTEKRFCLATPKQGAPKRAQCVLMFRNMNIPGSVTLPGMGLFAEAWRATACRLHQYVFLAAPHPSGFVNWHGMRVRHGHRHVPDPVAVPKNDVVNALNAGSFID